MLTFNFLFINEINCTLHLFLKALSSYLLLKHSNINNSVYYYPIVFVSFYEWSFVELLHSVINSHVIIVNQDTQDILTKCKSGMLN